MTKNDQNFYKKYILRFSKFRQFHHFITFTLTENLKNIKCLFSVGKISAGYLYYQNCNFLLKKSSI